MLLDYSDTQDEMDKLAFTLDRNKFTRSSSFTAGQVAEPVDVKPQVGQRTLLVLSTTASIHEIILWNRQWNNSPFTVNSAYLHYNEI